MSSSFEESKSQERKARSSMEREATKNGPLVVSRTEDGFRVYAVRDRFTVYVVKDGTCTCPEFTATPNVACEHVVAAERFQRMTNGSRHAGAPNEGGDNAMNDERNGDSQLTIKRSVSPDGRIDSLSVEVGFPVESLSVAEIRSRAERALEIQKEIAGRFLDGARNGTGNSSAQVRGNGNDPSVPAELLYVGGMNGRFGRRLFLVIRTDDRNLRMYGNRRELAEHLLAAGAVGYEGRINEGLALNVPCRVVTKPSEDGRYVNVAQILPVPTNGRNGR
jgi:hypothetical protein